jgi:hypothetical protein
MASPDGSGILLWSDNETRDITDSRRRRDKKKIEISAPTA